MPKSPAQRPGSSDPNLTIRFFGLTYCTFEELQPARTPVVPDSVSKFCHEAPAAGAEEPVAMSTSLL